MARRGVVDGELRPQPLAWHCRYSPIEMVAELLKNGADANELDDQDHAPLYCAARDGRLDVVDLLVQSGADVNECGDRALRSACRRGHVEVVKYLASFGVDTHRVDSNGRTLLFCAVWAKNPLMIKFLLSEGLSAMDEDNAGGSVFDSVMNEHKTIDLAVLQELLSDAQLDVNVRDENGQTALHRLCWTQEWSCAIQKIVFLISCGGKEALTMENHDGYRPLHCAAKSIPYSSRATPVLLEAGADARALTRTGRPPLAIMLFEHNYPPDKFGPRDALFNAMRALISHSAEWDGGCEKRFRFLEKLMALSWDELYDRDAEFLQSDGFDESVCRVVRQWLYFATLKRYEEQHPLRTGTGCGGSADRYLNPLTVLGGLRKCALYWIQERDSEGVQSMSLIPYRVPELGEAEVDKWFQCASEDRGAIALDASLRRGTLHRACFKGKPLETVRKYLRQGYDPNGLNDKGKTPLQCAARSGHLEIAQILVEAGAILEAMGKDGSTALMFACAYGHLNFVQQFLAQGLDVNATDQNGKTLLHYAVLYCRRELVDFLLSQGADPMAVDNHDTGVPCTAVPSSRAISSKSEKAGISV